VILFSFPERKTTNSPGQSRVAEKQAFERRIFNNFAFSERHAILQSLVIATGFAETFLFAIVESKGGILKIKSNIQK
jgi:hypothetical protein